MQSSGTLIRAIHRASVPLAITVCIAGLYLLDRLLFAEVEAALMQVRLCQTYPVLDADCVAGRRLGDASQATAIGLVLSIGVIALLYRHGRQWAAAPFAGLLAAIFLVSFAIDLMFERTMLSPTVLSTVYSALSVLLVIASVSGAALRPMTSGIALAACFYAVSILIRFASFQLLVGLWPMLFDAGRMAVLFSVVVLVNSSFAVLALVGPTVLTHAPTPRPS